MKSIAGARVLSGTVLELATFARSNGYQLQSDRRGYITFIPAKTMPSGQRQTNNVIQFQKYQP